MQNTNQSNYREIVDNALWKQQCIIKLIDEVLGNLDLHLAEDYSTLLKMEMHLIAVEVLVDSLKAELCSIIPFVQLKKEQLSCKVDSSKPINKNYS